MAPPSASTLSPTSRSLCRVADRRVVGGRVGRRVVGRRVVGRRVVVILLLSIAILGCDSIASSTSSTNSPSSPSPSSSTEWPSSPRVDASDLVAKFECARCHEVPGVELAATKSCVGCHQSIHAGTFVGAKPHHIAAWQKRITSLNYAPSFAAMDRLNRAWVKQFLLSPHDIRPALPARMPRLAITDEEAGRLAAYLVPDPPSSSSESASSRSASSSSVEHGAALFRSLACARCHAFTGSPVDDATLHTAGRELGGAWQLAPDLRHTRERMTRERIATWIHSPRGAMPAQGVSLADARSLAELIATTPLAPTVTRTVPERLPILERRVEWAELEKRIFRSLCWHCHAQPDFARGDGGPGNTGGFGFAPRGLDLSTYTGINAGSLDDEGNRRSIFAKLPDGTPRIIAHLMARHAEEAGQATSVRGMPLGLPPLSLEDIQLVETWIVQGRPH